MIISMLVSDASIPTSTLSLVFGLLFLITTLLHLYRLIKLRRRIYLYLFTFSGLRTIAFGLRIAWSQKPGSEGLAIMSWIVLSGFTFLIIFGIYDLLISWIISTTNSPTSVKIISQPQSEKGVLLEVRMVEIIKYTLPAFSIFGVVGAIQKYSSETNNIYSGKLMRMVSTLGFLSSLILYMIFVTYFALAYGSTPISRQLKALFLYMCGILLLIEFIYRTLMIFADATDMISRYAWIPHVFEMMPEVLLLVILGGIILGEWFFNDESPEEVKGSRTKSSVFPKV
ncbi:4257_t:CDS:1 [Acaulospora morrowiae]|uniref:4257_t:CDS:1 n=1 Tax=Acaulospora morrowiae TaxID=94023 RepID=A0A9N9AAD5_9GLOM|nr:4257_t:CDS:1 [Acaulospora morrowiae]